jgi:lipooligosaccharide transport system ATP-binding protein
MREIIRGHRLVKRFGTLTAVDSIDFAVLEGECFGILGPNGAGKTSTIRMITCVSPLTSGELTVDGLDVRSDGRRIKAIVGVVPQDDNLDPDLSVWQNLVVYARYFDLSARETKRRAEQALELFQLLDRRNERVEALSGGMRRRLIVARALINEPRILMLDEPTTGLDPQARHLVWQKLRYFKNQGVSMLLTTHYMEEAAHLCDRLVIMHLGRILVEGRPAELVARHVGEHVVELHLPEQQRRRAVQYLGDRDGLTIEEVEDILYVFGLGGDRGRILAELSPSGEGMLVRPGTLEDVFLRLTGRGLLE